MPDEVMKLVEELEAGLEGVTDGPWDVMTCLTVRAVDGDLAIPLFDTRTPWIKHRRTSTVMKQEWRNAHHIARCSPDNIRKLIAALKSHPRPSEEAVSGDAQAIADRLRRFFDQPGDARRLALDAAMMIEYLNTRRAAPGPSEESVEAAAKAIHASSAFQPACGSWVGNRRVSEQQAMEAARAAVSAIPHTGGVKVKALEWWNDDFEPQQYFLRALTPFGSYYLWTSEDLYWWAYEDNQGQSARKEAEAKASVQADYEKRILSALSTGEANESSGAIRVCPMRDAICPHGPTCPYNRDYDCDMDGSRAALSGDA